MSSAILLEWSGQFTSGRPSSCHRPWDRSGLNLDIVAGEVATEQQAKPNLTPNFPIIGAIPSSSYSVEVAWIPLQDLTCCCQHRFPGTLKLLAIYYVLPNAHFTMKLPTVHLFRLNTSTWYSYPVWAFVVLTAPHGTCSSIYADEENAFFEEKIRPVLIDYCYKCHSDEADEPAGGLFLHTRKGIREGGELGPAVVPEDIDESLLISAMEYRDLEMPPDEQLDEAIIADFRKWIEMGAPDPRTDDEQESAEPMAKAEPAAAHWSLQPVANPPTPKLNDSQSAPTAIDTFVQEKIEAAGLTPAGEADPATLLRRLSFDLTGLPPTPEDLRRFTSEPTKAAYAEAVDQLLSSPQFGERWGRHWLDVVRYGESAGSSRDVLMLYSWRYRDYVIDAFNNDLPYDRFVRQQVAGDLLPHESDQERRTNLIATGVLAIGSKSLNGGNLPLDIADDQIDIVSKAFMGLTVSCARCHDHKFDPIPTADYYAMAGIFQNAETFYGGSTRRPKTLSERLKVYLPLSADFTARSPDLAKLNRKSAQIAKRLKPLPNRIKTLERALPKDWKSLQQQISSKSDADQEIPEKTKRQLEQYQKVKQQVVELNKQLKELDQQIAELPSPEFAFGVQEKAKPRNFPIQVRGDKGSPGDIVSRGFLSCVQLPDKFEIPDRQSGRLQLAEWLTHPQHPLTARVMVNRIWQHLFGKGIVESTNNFGISGSPPTHPELLDYLAHRFVHVHEWSTKSLIREIVFTHTYQQSSDNNAEAWQMEAANSLLWRANRRRLEAEAIRDAVLVASGQLNFVRPAGSLVQQIGEGEVGRNINTKPLEEPFPHRSIYLPIIRGLLPEILKTFDFPEPSNPASSRSITNVPTQSLFLMNSEFIRSNAAALANRITESSSATNVRLQHLWEICLSRQPTETEVAMASAFLQEWPGAAGARTGTDAWTALCHSIFASAEFRFID